MLVLGLFAALMALTRSADAAFPGVIAGRNGQRLPVTTAHVVVLVRPPLAVVTVFAEVDSAPQPLLLLLPVTADVRVGEVRTVKRDLLARLERLTAPRFHAFYEQDPCDPSAPVQAWQHQYLPRDTGFLHADDPSGPDDRVSREISVSLDPVFKEPVSEYAFSVLDPARDDVRAWLDARGFSLPASRLSALLERARAGRLLAAVVDPRRAEIAATGGRERLPLAGVRYIASSEALQIPARLGLEQSPGFQDLFVYVLDASRTYGVVNYAALPAPTSLHVAPEARERVGELYDALHDRLAAQRGPAFLTEFAWPTDGCGEPCPDAPLEPAELASLGADVIEARLVSKAEREPEPARSASAAPPAGSSIREAREARQIERELARRSAFRRRHRYVLTRLHHRFDREGLPQDPVLAPAPAIAGGTGVPQGREGALAPTATSPGEPRFQVRFHGLERYNGAVACPDARRWRWGRRWDSLARERRDVPLGRDLPNLRRDAIDPDRAVLSPLPGLLRPAASASATPSAGPSSSAPASGRCSCRGVGAPSRPGPLVALLAMSALMGGRRWRRRREPR